MLVAGLCFLSAPCVFAQSPCEGDFDCDGDCDGTDAAVFKHDFGRSAFNNPCTSENPCVGDFDDDGDCDGTDAAVFKEDFGRSEFNNPCPPCCTPVESPCSTTEECCFGCCCEFSTGDTCLALPFCAVGPVPGPIQSGWRRLSLTVSGRPQSGPVAGLRQAG